MLMELMIKFGFFTGLECIQKRCFLDMNLGKRDS